jgi:hypothetical protein
MTRFYVQTEAGVREKAAALAVALGVGGLSFYLVRMLLAREDVESRAPSHPSRKSGRNRRATSEGAR